MKRMKANQGAAGNAVGRLAVFGVQRFGDRTVTLPASRFAAGSAPVLAVWSSKFYCDQPHRVPELERSPKNRCTRNPSRVEQ